MSDTDKTLRAKLARALHRGGYYEPRGISVDGIVNAAPVATSDQGRTAELVNQMAREDACPVLYKRTGQAVMLETDSQDWVAAYIRRMDADQLTWDLENR